MWIKNDRVGFVLQVLWGKKTILIYLSVSIVTLEEGGKEEDQWILYNRINRRLGSTLVAARTKLHLLNTQREYWISV